MSNAYESREAMTDAILNDVLKSLEDAHRLFDIAGIPGNELVARLRWLLTTPFWHVVAEIDGERFSALMQLEAKPTPEAILSHFSGGFRHRVAHCEVLGVSYPTKEYPTL